MLKIVAIPVQKASVNRGNSEWKTRTECVESPEAAFGRFQAVLRKAVHMPKEELDRRIALDNAARTADRVQRGYKKRGPKRKVISQ